MPLKKLRVAVFREAAARQYVIKRKGKNRSFAVKTPRVKPHETKLMVNEEQDILDYLTQVHPHWVNLWKMLNELCGPRQHWTISRPRRQRLLATFIRLKNEQRTVYTKKGYVCALSPSEAKARGLLQQVSHLNGIERFGG